MSKRKSVGSSKNTLFNYFTNVTPNAPKKLKYSHDETDEQNDNNKPGRQPTPSPKGNNHSGSGDEDVIVHKRKKRITHITPLDSDDSDTEIKDNKAKRQPMPPPEENGNTSSGDEVKIHKRKKRIRLNPLDSDDSDTENKDNRPVQQKKISVEKKLHDSFKYEANQTPKQKKTLATDSPKPSSSKVEPIAMDASPVADEGNWVHCKLDWLKPDKIRDGQKRRPDHPDYDPTTLYVPPNFYNNQTPAHRQWWEMKASHFDCVLFFKVGKFYELYHMDAAVGVNELGFSYMKGEFAHSGFPESAYARMASTLVSKGYKVARVEQTETPDMMQERCKTMRQATKWDKVVRREICQVTLRGTQVCGLQDSGPSDASAAYMMAIAEEESQGRSTYGVCFVDTSIGLFHLGQFTDDKHSSRLLTTLSHYPPALIVFERKTTSGRTSRLLATHVPGARREPRAMPPPERTLKSLAENYYRTNVDGEWPEGLRPFLHEGDALGLTPAANSFLAIKALGGCVAYLTDCLLDVQVLGMSQFTSYEPPDVISNSQSQGEKRPVRWEGGNTMVLDAITLRNLRIVQDEGCLYDKLNYCSTAMGKRLLYQWVCAPSCNLNVIKERQEAVRALFENQELSQSARNILTTLPDLERLLAKVHSLGNLLKSKTHPDSRAIFYEEKIYSKRKVLDFISVLNGFTAALEMVQVFQNTDSALLKAVTQFSPDGKYPDYRDTLKFFKEGFNQSEAEKLGVILPGAGVDPEYDSTLRKIKGIDDELKDYLTEQEKYFRCRLSYVGTDKKRYQLEVPASAASKAGGDYQLEGTRKGFKKFSTAETRQFLARMIAAEEQKRVVLKDLSRRIFERFSSHYGKWEAAVQCIATLDILLALAEFARQQTTDVCLPNVTFDDARPYINITEGRHPCIPIANEFVPNDTTLGCDGPSLLLLTGPNMGGKSTLMRQAGLLVVLAQLGSYVPAVSCSLSMVDRIFTRLGASDDILSGQSTFLVEMMETAAIVEHATVHSLVLLDELGRGTSTYDGTAIASGVCAELATRGCRVVFSTHYHSLVNHLASHPGVQLGHMACLVETDESTSDSEDHIPEETITFLYKLSPGACPKSYGFNAARLAGISRNITTKAHQISRQLENEATGVRAFRHILNMEASGKDVRKLLADLSI